MRASILVAGALLVGAGIGCATLLLLRAESPGELPRDDSAAATRFAELERRLARLEHEIASMVQPAPVRATVVAPRPSSAAEAPAPTGAPGSAADRNLDPRALLAEYVHSFDGGGEGSEFFRLAVAAYARVLRNELAALVVDAAMPDALRVQVMQMLSGAGFRGDAVAIDALLAVLRQGGWERGAETALAGLDHIGDRVTAGLLADLAPALDSVRVRCEAYQVLVRLFGGEADAAIVRLFERERDSTARAKLIELLTGADAAAALRGFELASRAELPVRLAGAQHIGAFRDEPYRQLVDEWLTREEDERVRQLLGAARNEQRSIPSWHELQACGPPDVSDPTHDDAHAWASAQPDAGREWLELAYDPPRRANGVDVHEVCAAGAVVAIEVLDQNGAWHTAWSGRDPTREPGTFEVRFPTTGFAVARLRVVLDTSLTPGWNEIDAVELVGPDGRAWASGATASSRYGASRGADARLELEGFKVDKSSSAR